MCLWKIFCRYHSVNIKSSIVHVCLTLVKWLTIHMRIQCLSPQEVSYLRSMSPSSVGAKGSIPTYILQATLISVGLMPVASSFYLTAALGKKRSFSCPLRATALIHSAWTGEVSFHSCCHCCHSFPRLCPVCLGEGPARLGKEFWVLSWIMRASTEHLLL